MATENINILILSAGRRVELVNCFKAARDRLKINGKVVAADINPTAPAPIFADVSVIVPRISDDNYIDSVIEVCKKHSISLIVPTIDTELEKLAKNRGTIEKATKARVLISDFKSVSICCDKYKTAQFFEKNNFDYPKVISLKDIETGNFKFPLFIKPLNGSSSINAFKVNNQKELDFFLEYVPDPIVQECVSGQEYSIDILTDFHGNPILVVPRKRLAVRSGEILKGQIDKNKEIIEISKRLVKKLSYVGMLTVQGFWTNENKLLLIEMNARFGGGAPMSIKSGADFCEKLYQMLNGETLANDESYNDGTLVVRFDDSVVVNG